MSTTVAQRHLQREALLLLNSCAHASPVSPFSSESSSGIYCRFSDDHHRCFLVVFWTLFGRPCPSEDLRRCSSPRKGDSSIVTRLDEIICFVGWVPL